MRFLRPLSIRHKLSAIIMATCTMVLLVSLAAFIFYERLTLRQAFLEKYTTLAEVIGINSTAALTFQDQKAAEATLAALKAESDVVKAAILDRQGQVFATFYGPEQNLQQSLGSDDGPLAESFQSGLKAFADFHRFYPDHLDITRLIEMEGEPLGLVFLRASLKPLQGRLRWNALVGGAILLISLMIAYLLASRLQQVITRPIFGLAQTMQRVSENQDYAVKAVKESDDELGQLIDGFNDMLTQIQKRDAELERHRHHLAEQVAARTVELVKTNEDLKEAIQAMQRAQEETAMAQTLFTAAIQQTPAGVMIVGARGNRIRLINEAALEIMGADKEEADDLFYLSGLSKWRFYRQDGTLLPPEELALPQVIKQGKTFRNEEIKIVRADGTARWVLTNASPIRDPEGKIIAGVMVFPDITERKQVWEEKARLEAHLQQAQKMEAIGTLAGGVAHDFNNLLQAILGYTQILLLDKKPGDRGYESLLEIDKAAERGAELSRQLLTFSRKVESRLRPLDLNHQVKEVAKLLRRTIPRMIAVELSLTEEVWTINADPVQLEQVMLNLALNTRDAMPEGGKLSFTTANVVLDEDYCRPRGITPGPYVCLTVMDTGTGMDEQARAHLFEPFFTTKGPGQGTGLGLAMVYGIVQNHGGHITCESELGQGTVFRLYFPALGGEISLTEAQETRTEPLRGGQETILLVDDEENLRQLGQRMLQRFGYKLLTAASGEEALEVYQKERGRIDLVILDLVMPGMGGWGCLRELKKLDPNLKVILASGLAQELKAQEAGADGVLAKPYRLRQMLQAVRQALEVH